MSIQVFTGVILLAITVPTAGAVGTMAWRSRSLPGARPFLLVIFLALWWTIVDAVERMVPGLDAKLVWANVQFVPISFISVAWLAMTLDYVKRRRWLDSRLLALLCLVPLTTNVLAWTNQHHHLIRASVWLSTGGVYPVVGNTWGAWFWVHFAYSYALMAIAAGFLFATVISSPPLYRRQPAAVLAGSLIPLAANLPSTLAPSSAASYHYTSLAFAFAAFVVAWGLFRVRMFSLIPVARHSLVQNLQDGVLVLDRHERVADLNRSAQTLIGRPASRILGRTLAETWKAWEQLAAPHSAGASQAELDLGEGGRRRYYQVTWSPIVRRKQTMGRVLVLSDVTERRLLEDSLRDQALTDGLTGLPNRTMFISRLSDAIHQARRHQGVLFAVLILDIDRFKHVNDSLGHLAGDVLLQSVAAKLTRCVREADTVARMGGDEFIVLLHEISTTRDLLPVLDRIQEELRTPVYFQQQEMSAVSSIGVVIWDPSYEDPDDVVRAADTAMYQAKEDGRGRHRIFDEEMHKAVLRTLKDETDLRTAIRDRAFSLAYQPVVELQTGILRSLEGLLRWHHPERGTIFPRDFLAVAENSGLILPLGEIALDEVCSQMNRWQSSGHPISRLPVSVNVSARQLVEPDFVPSVLSRLNHWRVSSDRLLLEITESAMAVDPPKAKQAMRKLRGIGVHLCLDDFGASGSSLHYLTTYPVQELKIDPNFLSAVESSSKHSGILRHLIALAHALDLKVTAEGVEQAAQWELLREAGCDKAQGYYVASPMEPDVLLDFLDDLESAGQAAPVADTDSALSDGSSKLPTSDAPVWAMRHLLGEHHT